MNTSEERKCCCQCSYHGVGCIPSCYPEHCHNRDCSCHSTLVREESEFDKISANWDIASSVRPLINDFIRQNRLSLLERLEEEVGKRTKKVAEPIDVYSEKDLQYSQERNKAIGYNTALLDFVSLITHFKKEI